ncbi:uncharacterized protein [Panulirus ornatus]|uniref:uncharacterized protein n=1 Tax=Panulirus ornatus TaxID=150431 RepID=UPI003A84412A
MPHQHTTVDQVNFLSQWFVSWSEMQREDFLPILVQAYQPRDHINGLLGGIESLSVQGRRPSLFDCQIKLFHDWFGTWTENERNRLLEHLREIDPGFMSQYDKKIYGEPSQDDAPSHPECGEESQNPPSSVSSPPSTLPRSHSPHDSGLDEPPSDSDHTEPHSLDSCNDPEDVASAGSLSVNDAFTSSATMKSAGAPTAQFDSSQGDESLKLESVANGAAEAVKTVPTGEEMVDSLTVEETSVEQ